jgi:hypothetical protein
MSRSNMHPAMLLGVIQGVTGLSLEDLVDGALAETPEEKMKADGLVIRKMEAHRRGVPLSEVPDFMSYPETGFPSKDNSNAAT